MHSDSLKNNIKIYTKIILTCYFNANFNSVFKTITGALVGE